MKLFSWMFGSMTYAGHAAKATGTNHLWEVDTSVDRSSQYLPNNVLTGAVKWFAETRGFGVIKQDGGTDVFVHSSAIEGRKSLQTRQMVRFVLGTDPKGRPCAKNVIVIPDTQKMAA